MNDDAYKAIYNKALDIISRREHSQKELSDKLIKKFNIPELVDSVIHGLREKNVRHLHRVLERACREQFDPISVRVSCGDSEKHVPFLELQRSGATRVLVPILGVFLC